MATVDPTGLIPVMVQRISALVEEEIVKVVCFKDEFQRLAEDLSKWKPLLQGLDRNPHPPLISWLEDCNGWVDQATSLVQDCQAVDANGCAWRLSSINTKRELSTRIEDMREEFERLNRRIGLLILGTATVILGKVEDLAASKKEPSRMRRLQQKTPDELVDQKKKLEEILGMLTSPPPDNTSKWVGILGQGGSGKTVMAKQLNNNEDVIKCFDEQVFFVVVGGAAARKDLLRKLCKLVGCEFEEQNHESEIQSVLCTALQGKRVLLILDDVWDGRLLNLLNVVDGSKGSKILVTTRNRDLLEEKHALIYSAGLLSEEDSKRLFYNHAFGVGQDCPDLLRVIAGEMIERCGKLPLALEVVGSAMAAESGNLRQWCFASRSIRDRKYGEMSGLFQFSYERLSRLEQQCFLTMLSWPEDTEIEPLDLVYWWRGEGLIGCLSDDGWEEAEQILGTLVNRSIIQLAKSSNVFLEYRYRIHDVILELGLDHLLKDESELQEHEQGHLFLSSEKHWRMFLDSAACQKDQTRLRNLRKIICHENYNHDSGQLEQASQALTTAEFPRLRTILWKHIDMVMVAALMVKRSTSLEVVILKLREDGISALEARKFDFSSHLRLQTLHLSWDEDLWDERFTFTIDVLPPNVKCLDLEGVKGLKWRGEQENLEILMCECCNLSPPHLNLSMATKLSMLALKNSKLTTILHVSGPGDVSKMKHLDLSMKHLDLYGVQIERWPLSSPMLETASDLEVEDGGVNWMRMLSGGAPNLIYLQLCGSLGGMDSVRPTPLLPSLEKLALFCQSCQHPLPAIVSSSAAAQTLRKLRELTIRGFKVSDDQAAALHQLQNLQTLHLGFVGRLPPALLGLPLAFRHLRFLFLDGDFGPEFPAIGEGALPQLQTFRMDDCNKATTELVIGASSSSFKLENLRELTLYSISFKLLPAALITSASFKHLALRNNNNLERLEVEHQVEGEVGDSSLETLKIIGCPKMTLEGIPEVFKRMERTGQLKISKSNT